MNRLDRQPAPHFWSDKERQYIDRTTEAGEALRKWAKDGKTLATWFHECVRPAGEPNNCAYCDGILGVTSSETIDHFIPCHFDRIFGLAWTNLYPACQACNTDFKGRDWSCKLLRPDVDPVEDWIAFDPADGRLYPAPEYDRRIRARVRLTIRIFGLNAPIRCQSRRTAWKNIRNAMNTSDEETTQVYAQQGPYRMVSRLFLASIS
jgi:uncharacterized protein (TIGR02646 family)